MIFICVKWKVKPEYADQWVELTREFTEATRAEEGNLFFDWSRNVEDPNQYVLVEAFKDDAAEAHVTSEHFKKAQAELPQYVAGDSGDPQRADGGRPLGPSGRVRGELNPVANGHAA